MFWIDNPIAQGLLVKQLQRYQLNVTTTENGVEAIAGEFMLLTGCLIFTTVHRVGISRARLFQCCPV